MMLELRRSPSTAWMERGDNVKLPWNNDNNKKKLELSEAYPK